MILPFSTQINGKPTYFVEKILLGLANNNLITQQEWLQRMSPMPLVKYPKAYGFIFDKTIAVNPKIHTIREDKNDRWKAGTKIDFFINCRQPNMFQVCAGSAGGQYSKSSNKIYHTNTFLVHIDGKLFFFGNRDFTVNEFENHLGMLELAQNDGFDTIEDFFAYFSEDYTGKIIHWTDKQY